MNNKQDQLFSASQSMDKFRRKLSVIAHGKKPKQTCTQPKNACSPQKSASALVSACSALVPTRSCLRTSGQSSAPVIQNYQLVWLDSHIDELSDDNCRNTIAILRHTVNTVNTFVEVNECIEFVESVKEDKLFLIISGELAQSAVPVINDMSQITSIYILCDNKLEHESWIHKWSKIKGVFTDKARLSDALKQTARECDQNTISMSFIEMSKGSSGQKLTQLDQCFTHTYILKEIISTINFTQENMKEFLTSYRKNIVSNVAELGTVEKFEREYHDHGPVWWYTYQCFLYSMLNRVLRTMDEHMIIKMGFFIHDLQQYITQLYHKQNTKRRDLTPLIVYRGQGISQIDFDRLKKNENGLISFNNFLLASKDRQVSFDFARRTPTTSDLYGMLFIIKVDPSITSSPFANIRDVCSHSTEEDTLFSLQSIFRINQIKQMDHDRLWQVELTLVDDNDPQLHGLTENISEKTLPNRKGWCRLSELLIKEGHFSKAQQICDTIINQTTDEDEKGHLNYQIGSIKYQQGEYTEAKLYYNISLDIRQKFFPSGYIDIAACYNEIGLVYEKLNEYSKALSYLEKAMQIYEKNLSGNDVLLTNCNNNIARMYLNSNEYSKALLYYEKSLEIYQNTLPPNHPNIISTYNNIGSVYEKMGDFAKAISSLEKTLSIHKKCLLPNHSDIADSYHSIGALYEKMCEYTIAISYYEKALEINEEILPADHPDLAALHNNIGLVYFQRSDYMKSLASHEKAHEIYRKILPENHPHLASSYVCQGSVYEEMGKYTKALLYYKKAFEIYRNNPSSNPLDLAAFYHAIGSVYCQMGEYSTALSCHKKAFEIHEKTLPSNHPDLANSHVWYGDLYDKMGDHLKAYSSYQYAIDIGQHSLPANHPSLQRWKDNLEKIKKKL